MSARRKIAVLTHARDRFSSCRYHMNLLVDAWRKSGTEVVVLRGIDRFEDADALILHVDLTVVPDEYMAFSRKYPVVINGLVRDISKRLISGNLLKPGDSYRGEVIVKTDLNYGGHPERVRKRLGRFSNVLSGCLPWTWTGHLLPADYPVYPSLAAVPPAVWGNRRLVVEKFLPERRGEYYCLRQWIFLGDRGISQRLFSPRQIVKAANVVEREQGIPIPDSLRVAREKLGFDYGKFDFVLTNGEAVLLDANKTPMAGPNNPARRLDLVINEMAQGLNSFLAGLGTGTS